MECFVIFVMAWCWCNATESKPRNVNCYFKKPKRKNKKQHKNEEKNNIIYNFISSSTKLQPKNCKNDN